MTKKKYNETLSGSKESKTKQNTKETKKIHLKDEEKFDWEGFNLPEEIQKYEAEFIEKALIETNGSVTKAAELLSVSHQNLSLMLQRRHKDLAFAKKSRRRRSDRNKPKKK